MNVKRIVLADFLLDLANGFKERQTFNIADGAANFRDNNVGRVRFRHGIHASFDLVGDVRDNLNGRA